jgi:hypothetical protein
MVRDDNVGAIVMYKNASTSSGKRHVDVRYQFVREFMEEGFMRVVFVRSRENLSDEFIMNGVGRNLRCA